jgi:class 3 adenylate cyclase
MTEDRRLAAIMFTDIVGYTALMGKDEESAFKLLRKNRQVQKQIIEKHGGKWLKEIGDGNLASFSSASDAVRCAIAILEGCKKADILLRIGIHSGEVVFEDSDVFGDGVNVASRLQESAEEGCISISEAVYKDIKNKAGIYTKFVEEKTFKNVDEPVKVYKVQSEEDSKEDQKPTGDEELKKRRVRLVYILGGLIAVISCTAF